MKGKCKKVVAILLSMSIVLICVFGLNVSADETQLVILELNEMRGSVIISGTVGVKGDVALIVYGSNSTDVAYIDYKNNVPVGDFLFSIPIGSLVAGNEYTIQLSVTNEYSSYVVTKPYSYKTLYNEIVESFYAEADEAKIYTEATLKETDDALLILALYDADTSQLKTVQTGQSDGLNLSVEIRKSDLEAGSYMVRAFLFNGTTLVPLINSFSVGTVTK